MQKIIMQSPGSENKDYATFPNSASTDKNTEDFLFACFPGTGF